MKNSQVTPETQQGAQSGRSLWRNTDFLLLWSGQTVSTLGTSISALALPLLMLALTHSPVSAGECVSARSPICSLACPQEHWWIAGIARKL